MPHVNCQTWSWRSDDLGGGLQSEDLGSLQSLCWPCALLPTSQAPGSSLVSRTGPLGMAEVCSALLWFSGALALWPWCAIWGLLSPAAGVGMQLSLRCVALKLQYTWGAMHSLGLLGLSLSASGSWGGLLSVSKAHTHRQSCKTVVVYLIFCFVLGGLERCIILFTFTFSYTDFWLNFCWHCEICCILFILRIGNWFCSCFFLVFFSVFEPLRNKKEGRRWLYV